MPANQEKVVELVDPFSIPIDDIEKATGAPLPAKFQTCFLCHDETRAVALLCGTLDTEIEGPGFDRPYVDPDAEMLSQALRANFHHQAELPVCTSHLNCTMPN